MPKPATMRESSTKKIYDLHSTFYDITFGRLVRKRIAGAIQRMNIAEGETVLDVGIGTGASLAFYPHHARVFGIDLSAGMLREARKKIQENGLDHVRLFQGNALGLPFEPDTFDHIFVSHVISVVSDPVELIKEVQRVARRDAKIVMVNHFQSTNRFLAMLETWASPLCTKLGWRSDLALNDLVNQTGAEIDYRYKLTTPDLWETVVMTNTKSALTLEPAVG